jgi:hypothetical protein
MGGNAMFWLYVVKVHRWRLDGLGDAHLHSRNALVVQLAGGGHVGIVIFVAWVGLDPFYPKNNLLSKTRRKASGILSRFGEKLGHRVDADRHPHLRHDHHRAAHRGGFLSLARLSLHREI